MRTMTLAGGFAALMLMLVGPVADAQTITQILDGTHGLNGPMAIAVESTVEGAGNVYVAAVESHNVFKITPGGTITEIIDSTGDGTHGLTGPTGVAVDASGNAYVTGVGSGNAFKITPDGTITQIIDATGDGAHDLISPRGIAVDASENVFVTGSSSDNVFRITPGGTITEIISSTHGLNDPRNVAVDPSGNVYIPGVQSHNAFKITPGGTITQIINSAGDGIHELTAPWGIAADASGNAYVTGLGSDNAFKITPGGTITEIINAAHGLSTPRAVTAEASGNAYVAGSLSANAFKITSGGTVTEIIDATGDGTHGLSNPWAVVAEDSGVVYVAGLNSDNVFKITPQGMALSEIAGLIVPGFEVAVGEPQGPTTLFAVRNTTDQQVFGRLDYFGAASTALLRTDAFVLDPWATLPRNVRDDLSELEIEDGLATGFIVVTEIGGTTAPNLVGDYFRVDYENDFAAGDRLVRPVNFCLRQEIRFVDFGSGSELRILVNRPRGDEVPSFSYTAYDQAGTQVAQGDIFTPSYLLMLDIGALVATEHFGTIYFDFSSSGGGWVCAKYSAFGRFSIELNAACRDG